jgi:drug/metabolite transporter (DMT)-like permease
MKKLKKPKLFLPYLALIFAQLIWGGSMVISKISLQEFPPNTLAFLRFTIALILLMPFFTVITKKVKIKAEHIPKILLAGLTMITFNIFFLYQGLLLTTTINAAVLTLSLPILSVVAGWWFLKEKVYWINLLGILLGVFGAILIIGLPLLFVGNLTGSMLLGNVMLILASASYVIGAIISKKLLKSYSSLFLTAAIFLVGALSFLPAAINDYIQNPLWFEKVTILGILGLLYLAILSSISAYFLYDYALEKVEVSKANLFQYIEPAIVATLAVPILGERISFSFIIGTCLIVLGVYWGTLGKLEHHHLHHKHHRV